MGLFGPDFEIVDKFTPINEFAQSGEKNYWIITYVSDLEIEKIKTIPANQVSQFLTNLCSASRCKGEFGLISGITLHESAHKFEDGTLIDSNNRVLRLEYPLYAGYRVNLTEVWLHREDYVEITPSSENWDRPAVFTYTNPQLGDWDSGPWLIVPFEAQHQELEFGFNLGLPRLAVDEYLESREIKLEDGVEYYLASGDEKPEDYRFGAVDYGNVYLRKSRLDPKDIVSLYFTTGQSTWFREDLRWIRKGITAQLENDWDFLVDKDRAADLLAQFDSGKKKLSQYEKFLK